MWSAKLSYELPAPDKLELKGSMDGKEISRVADTCAREAL